MTDPPIGDLCVLRDSNKNSWSVAICSGAGTRKSLGTFLDRDRAYAFALEERDRRRKTAGVELTVHFPDDCPCYTRLGGTDPLSPR